MCIANMLHYISFSSFQLPAASSVAFFCLTRIMEEKTMNNYNYNYKEQAGRSMIEMLGVLAIIGVLSVGGIAGYSKAMNKFKTNKVADNVSMLVANIKTLYAQQKTYGGLTNESAVAMGVVPDELGTTAKLTNAFNGDVYISTADSTKDDDNKAFNIVFDGLSREACITLATNDWGSGYSSGLIAMAAQGSAIGNKVLSDKIGCDGGDNVNFKTATKTQKPNPDTSKSGGSGNNPPVQSQSFASLEPQADTPTPAAKSGYTACPGKTMPMSVTKAATACSCTSGNTCGIAWKYY